MTWAGARTTSTSSPGASPSAGAGGGPMRLPVLRLPCDGGPMGRVVCCRVGSSVTGDLTVGLCVYTGQEEGEVFSLSSAAAPSSVARMPKKSSRGGHRASGPGL
ncbi:hypothetical protein chiPu_0015162 [Chiloscyllium punctatum]|uniref:Uncharacterized protein n=1 Tax=Chiloscyllium punctatum TaxID=137246 RepID=A0A401T1Z2_CHIPU|nr:hypothetical protein [Chiloscyllium punctatum]